MKNFNNDGEISVQGNFNITDNANTEHKLYIHCTNEELIADRPFRADNIDIEQKKKSKKMMPLYGVAIFLLFAAAIWAMYQGKTDLITILMGASAVFVGYQSILFTIEPNAFQREEQDAVNEITKILKQRRVE